MKLIISDHAEARSFGPVYGVGRLRTLLRTDPAGALKQFNNDLAPMLAAVWVERRRLGTSRQGARLDAIREAGREE